MSQHMVLNEVFDINNIEKTTEIYYNKFIAEHKREPESDEEFGLWFRQQLEMLAMELNPKKVN